MSDRPLILKKGLELPGGPEVKYPTLSPLALTSGPSPGNFGPPLEKQKKKKKKKITSILIDAKLRDDVPESNLIFTTLQQL